MCFHSNDVYEEAAVDKKTGYSHAHLCWSRKQHNIN